MVEQRQETKTPDPKLGVFGGNESFEVPFGVGCGLFEFPDHASRNRAVETRKIARRRLRPND